MYRSYWMWCLWWAGPQAFTDVSRNFSSSSPEFALAPFSDQLSLNDSTLAPSVTKLLPHPVCQLGQRRSSQMSQRNPCLVFDCWVRVSWLLLTQSLEPSRSCPGQDQDDIVCLSISREDASESPKKRIRVTLSEAGMDPGRPKRQTVVRVALARARASLNHTLPPALARPPVLSLLWILRSPKTRTGKCSSLEKTLGTDARLQ